LEAVDDRMKVLVTNAEYSNALAAVRSLGEKSVEVVAGSSRRLAQSFCSRYTSSRVIYPDPENGQEFVRFLDSYIAKENIDAVIPVGYSVTTLLSKHLSQMKQARSVPVANQSAMAIASDKAKTAEFARTHGVPAPESFASPTEVHSFPVVVKGSIGSGQVRYVNTREELLRTWREGKVIQEYVKGDGYGFFALFNEGKLRASFMHRRLREFPASGGASTAAVSINDSELREVAIKLLEPLGWHGVIMAEFKKSSRDGRFVLMELNPKFWGSLDLAIASGVDFPYLLARMTMEGDVEPVETYREGVKFRWPFPNDFMNALATGSIRGFAGEFFDKSVGSNLRLDDPGPATIQLMSVPTSIIKTIRRGSVKYPEGAPRSV